MTHYVKWNKRHKSTKRLKQTSPKPLRKTTVWPEYTTADLWPLCICDSSLCEWLNMCYPLRKLYVADIYLPWLWRSLCSDVIWFYTELLSPHADRHAGDISFTEITVCNVSVGKLFCKGYGPCNSVNYLGHSKNVSWWWWWSPAWVGAGRWNLRVR